MIEIAVAGASGRMGLRVMELASRDPRFSIAAALTFVGDEKTGRALQATGVDMPLADRLGVPCDVLIDFSTPSGTVEWLKVCERLEIPLITGVTGHDTEQRARLAQGARVIPIVAAANFSVGMDALMAAVGILAQKLAGGFDVELVETHHRGKADAPSGTALAILTQIGEAAGLGHMPELIFGRQGSTKPRPGGAVGVHSVRMGDVVGRHEVHFSGVGETVTIQHNVHSRDTFVAGALRAAAWVVDRPPGLYAMRDVIASAAEGR